MGRESKHLVALRELAPQRLRLAVGEVLLALALTGLAIIALAARS